MTREEFEYAIKSCGCFIYRGQTYYEESEMMKAFEDMGLIEQEQSGDLIQRQDDRGVSLKSVKHILYDVCLHEDNMALFSKLLDRVNKLRDWEEYLTIKQEPSGDAISRQAVMDCFKKWQPYMATRLWDFEQELSALPSISPQPCEDAISRQALLDAFGFSEKTRKWGGDHSGYNTMMLYEIQDIIESQPPVNPQEPKKKYDNRWFNGYAN